MIQFSTLRPKARDFNPNNGREPSERLCNSHNGKFSLIRQEVVLILQCPVSDVPFYAYLDDVNIYKICIIHLKETPVSDVVFAARNSYKYHYFI